MTMPAPPSVNTKKRQREENYKDVLAFAKEHKHLNLPHKHADTRRLSHWLNRQRTRNLTNYEREKMALLKEFGYKDDSEWVAQDETVWNAFFNKMMEHKRVHFVVAKKDKDNQKLCDWIAR